MGLITILFLLFEQISIFARLLAKILGVLYNSRRSNMKIHYDSKIRELRPILSFN